MMLFFNNYTCTKKSGGGLKQRNKIFAEVPKFSIQLLAIRGKKWIDQLVESVRETSAVPSFPRLRSPITCGLSLQALFSLAKWCYSPKQAVNFRREKPKRQCQEALTGKKMWRKQQGKSLLL